MPQLIQEANAVPKSTILGVHHVAMATTDLEAQQRFYCEQFGMKHVAGGAWKDAPETDALVGLPRTAARFALLRSGNIALELFQYFSPDPGPADLDRPVSKPGITHLCFAVSDLDAEYDRLCRAGVRFHAPPAELKDASTIRAVYGRDPEGNVFELLQICGDTPFDYSPSLGRWRDE